MIKGSDCTKEFRAAYENRYTWEIPFCGYKGNCSWAKDEGFIEGSFTVGTDLKLDVFGVDDEIAKKAFLSQLWEVSIHRVRRPFEQTHGQNTFTAGEENEFGLEVLVGGKNKGDKYHIKDDVVTMVYRNIHGSLINIFTHEIVQTGNGYLSKRYSSQYLDPVTKKPLRKKNIFTDEFFPLDSGGPWVLGKRSIETEGDDKSVLSKELFIFSNLARAE